MLAELGVLQSVAGKKGRDVTAYELSRETGCEEILISK